PTLNLVPNGLFSQGLFSQCFASFLWMRSCNKFYHVFVTNSSTLHHYSQPVWIAPRRANSRCPGSGCHTGAEAVDPFPEPVALAAVDQLQRLQAAECRVRRPQHFPDCALPHDFAERSGEPLELIGRRHV